MPEPKPFLQTLVDAVHDEMDTDSAKLAFALKNELDPNYVNPGASKYLDWWRQNWTDPNWRSEQLDRVGPDQFLKTSYEAFGLTDEMPNFEKLSHLDVEPSHLMPNSAIGPDHQVPVAGSGVTQSGPGTMTPTNALVPTPAPAAGSASAGPTPAIVPPIPTSAGAPPSAPTGSQLPLPGMG